MTSIIRYRLAPFINIVMIAPIAIVMMACSDNATPEASKAALAPPPGDTVVLTAVQVQQLRLSVASVVQSTIAAPLHVNGIAEVAPQNRAVMSAPMGGTVSAIHVHAGQKVAAGAALVTLQHRDFVSMQQDYLTTIASLTAAQSELARQERLAQEQVNARKVVEQLTAEVTGLRVKATSLREQLALLGINASKLTETSISRSVTLRAPFAGYVTDVSTSIGAATQPNDVLVSLVNTSNVYADMSVYERDAANIAEGQSIDLRMPGDTVPFRATVSLVGRSVAADRTVRVHAALRNPPAALRPGMGLTGTIGTLPRTAIVVPSACIMQWQGASWIFTQESPTMYRRHAVTVGTTDNGLTEITGTSASQLVGTPVVVRGAAG
ncbi:MAG: efflux RND transporter periplasmic adaptor subunit, partial [Candidatus Kapabacteria bacterium]|nr:efflux RND transporter periplasmic adaptor subunit [Candidatus Kapabacteria bacterium]